MGSIKPIRLFSKECAVNQPDYQNILERNYSNVIFSRPEDRHGDVHRHHRLHRPKRRLLGPRGPRVHAAAGFEPGTPGDEGTGVHRAGRLARRLQHLPGRRPPLRLRRLRPQDLLQGDQRLATFCLRPLAKDRGINRILFLFIFI